MMNAAVKWWLTWRSIRKVAPAAFRLDRYSQFAGGHWSPAIT
jgi:hypothetical protein